MSNVLLALKLLRPIVQDPDNDQPRLDYATGLALAGEDARARLIRTQCELARMPADDPRRARLLEIEKTLLEQHGQEWLQELGLTLPDVLFRQHDQERLQELGLTWPAVLFRRGFIEFVILRIERFLEEAERLLQLTPLRGARIVLPRLGAPVRLALLAELAACPSLGRLQALDLADNNLTDDELKELCGSEYLANLRCLRLRDNDIGNAGAQALASCPHLGSLVELHLGLNRIGNKGARALARSPHLRGLVNLDLSGNRVGHKGARLILSGKLTRLKVVGLDFNKLDAEEIDQLRSLPEARRYEAVALDEYQDWDDFGSAVAVSAFCRFAGGSPLLDAVPAECK